MSIQMFGNILVTSHNLADPDGFYQGHECDEAY